MSFEWITTYFNKPFSDILWIMFGFFGQFMFSMRFLIQWLKSEITGQSIIPMAFWYFSIAGSLVLLMYSLHTKDLVYITAQLFGIVVYTRNLILIRKSRRALGSENLSPS